MAKKLFLLLCVVVSVAAMLTGCEKGAEEVPASEAPKGAAQMAPGSAGGPGGAPGAAGAQSAKPASN